MDIVVARAVREAERVRQRLQTLALEHGRHPGHHRSLGVALGIRLRRVHEALGVVRIVEVPVVHAAAGDAAAEILRIAQHQHGGRRAAEGEALHADARAIHIRQRLQPLRPGDVVLQLDHRHPAERLVHAPAPVLPRRAGIHHDIDDAVLIAPLIGSVTVAPAVAHVGRARAAVELHLHGIFLRRVKPRGQGHQTVKVKAVVLDLHDLRLRMHLGHLHQRGIDLHRIFVRPARNGHPGCPGGGSRRLEGLPVLGNPGTGHIQFRIRQRRHAALAVQAV